MSIRQFKKDFELLSKRIIQVNQEMKLLYDYQINGCEYRKVKEDILALSSKILDEEIDENLKLKFYKLTGKKEVFENIVYNNKLMFIIKILDILQNDVEKINECMISLNEEVKE